MFSIWKKVFLLNNNNINLSLFEIEQTAVHNWTMSNLRSSKRKKEEEEEEDFIVDEDKNTKINRQGK